MNIIFKEVLMVFAVDFNVWICFFFSLSLSISMCSFLHFASHSHWCHSRHEWTTYHGNVIHTPLYIASAAKRCLWVSCIVNYEWDSHWFDRYIGWKFMSSSLFALYTYITPNDHTLLTKNNNNHKMTRVFVVPFAIVFWSFHFGCRSEGEWKNYDHVAIVQSVVFV